MASSVKSLSNHYEVLELAPTASLDEIVKAFSSHMRAARVRPDISVARLAQLSVAYETLREPARRRAYDDSLGLNRAAAAAGPGTAVPFIGVPVRAPLAPRTTQSEPRVAAFIAESLRQPQMTARSEPAARAVPAALPDREPSLRLAAENLVFEDGRLALGRTGATLAAGAVGIVLLAAVAALPDNNPDRLSSSPERAEPSVTVPLPSAAGSQRPAMQSPVADQESVPKAETAPRPRTAPVPPKTQLAPLHQQQPTQSPAAQPASSGSSIASPDDQGASSAAADPSTAVTDASEASATATSLPLPKATIARTIERIGYACGSVSDVTATDGGAGGVFKITCSSGDSYRAAPVQGRYHFRRWGSHAPASGD